MAAGTHAFGAGGNATCSDHLPETEMRPVPGLPLRGGTKDSASACSGQEVAGRPLRTLEAAEDLPIPRTDPLMAYVIVSFLSAAFPGIIVYLFLWFLMPKEDAA